MNIIPSVTRVSDNEQIFGSLNIGKLTPTNLITMKGKPVFLNEKGEKVFCDKRMSKIIEERLKLINNN